MPGAQVAPHWVIAGATSWAVCSHVRAGPRGHTVTKEREGWGRTGISQLGQG